MPIRISSDLRGRLPAGEREGIEDYLWVKSNARCFLCEGPMNRAADILEADHDSPGAEGGETTRDNLNLVHSSCNRFKRNAPSLDVRPFLRFRSFVQDNGGLLKYDDALPHFGVVPQRSVVSRADDSITFEFPNGSTRTAPIFSEVTRTGTFDYAFVTLPRQAIYNDDECQPRTIKLDHLWKIYSDLHRNPLHEPPGLRLTQPSTAGVVIVMFDGQHKTLANWLIGRDSIVAKVYLNLTTAQTTTLVNSIQSKIPKLPLSTFELAAKMDQETGYMFDRYLERAGETASESGFVASLAQADRERARVGFRAGLANALLDRDDLVIKDRVQRAGAPVGSGLMTETVFKRRVLDPLLYRQTLTDSWAQAQDLRVREQDNIVRLLNQLDERAFNPPEGGFSETESERVRRMTYQSSLGHIAGLLRRVVGIIVPSNEGRELLDREPNEEQWQRIVQAVDRLVTHPIWTCDLELSERTRAVRDALSLNQDADSAFRGVGLSIGYLVGDTLPAEWW